LIKKYFFWNLTCFSFINFIIFSIFVIFTCKNLLCFKTTDLSITFASTISSLPSPEVCRTSWTVPINETIRTKCRRRLSRTCWAANATDFSSNVAPMMARPIPIRCRLKSTWTGAACWSNRTMRTWNVFGRSIGNPGSYGDV